MKTNFGEEELRKDLVKSINKHYENTGFNKTELIKISSYCGNEYKKRYEAILKRQLEKHINIVNTGMVSSGKSSLFNALVGSEKEELFPTGAARTTTESKYCKINHITYIDTPGIDVRSEDDELAFHTIMEADIIMMVHNIKTGPLNRSESEWLQNIVSRMSDNEMKKARLVFICSWKDSREKDENYQNIIDDVKQMVFDIVGTEIPFFEVSVKKYQNGVAKSMDALVKNSGINELKCYLENYAEKYISEKEKMNQKELYQLLSEIKSLLVSVRKDSQSEVEKIQKKVGGEYKTKKNTWNRVFSIFSSKREQLETAQREYNSI